MKHKKVLIILLLLVIGSIFIFNSSTNKKKYFTVEGVKLAVGVDGTNQSDFPSMGEYNVSVNCTGVTGTWNYGNWELELSNMTSNSATCNINFTSAPNTHTKLNDKIISLSGTTQGTGQVVNEILSGDSSSGGISQSEYVNLNNDTSYPFSWGSTNNSWTSTNHSDSSTSTITFNLSSSGQYQFCYIQSSEQNYDYARVYKNNSEVINLKGTSNSEFQCKDLGDLTTSDTIKITYSKDGSASNGSDTVEFYLKKNVSAGYRYEGKNPNNYVLFNGELWRIIGVFDSDTHGQSGNLTKIIRDESIGSYAWHKSGTNDWSAASLNTILNTYYYNSQNGTGQTACYFYSTTVPGNCDFRYTGLDANARNMVQEVTWKLGGYSSYSATAEAFYGYERGTTVYSGRPTTATGYIGLMYPSDYGYSVLASSCARTTNLGSYSSSTCGGQSWLLKNGYEWTMTPRSSDSDYVFYVVSSAYLSFSNVDSGSAVRPTAYLKSSVYIVSGDGSEANPYVLGI